MELELRVYVDGLYFRGGASVTVPELLRECFEPIGTTDEPMLQCITGDLSTVEAKKVMKTRKDAAEILARNLTELILREMKSHDTHNGNPIEENLKDAILNRPMP